MSRTLGMDLGPNSIGWALVEYDENKSPSRLIDAGVRIFQEAVDLKTRTPKNQERRLKRSMRKRNQRKQMRRDLLLKRLVEHKMLPENEDERQRILLDQEEYNPYQLRARGLDEALTLWQFGRVLFHLNQRRGFKSGRKTSAGEDDGVVKASIAAIRKEMKKGFRTLGEYLNSLDTQRGKPHAPRYTDRDMYIEEFNLLWDAQQPHHPEVLTDDLRALLSKTIFFQRPLKIQKHLIGKCTFEPSRPRAARARLEAQRFRILQEVNSLKVKHPITFKYRPLLGDEREKLIAYLETHKEAKWKRVRTLLGLHEGEIFNLEEGKKDRMIGNQTAVSLRKILGKSWDEMSEVNRNQLVIDWFTIDDEKGFLRRMEEHWGFDRKTALALATLEPVPGYMRVSVKAIKRMLPALEEGMLYSEAAEAAGYDHARPYRVEGSALKLGAPSEIRNPIVTKALWEVRKVVHAILREHGRPDTIRIEMARDMKMGRKQRQEVQARQTQNKKRRDQAREILQRDFGFQHPSREDILKYLLWKECQMTCPYTGAPISEQMLFSNEVDIEHIIPYSISFDDSYMNKTLCLSAENRSVKKKQTPWQAYGHLENRWKEMHLRIRKLGLPYPKRKRFETKEIDQEDFVSRQLNDTRYISREVKTFLEQLGVDVDVSKGAATAALRRQWDLNRILAPDGSGEKNRADHRHHAIDAVVIALTTRSLFMKLSRLAQESPYPGGLNDGAFNVPEPWNSFQNDVREIVDRIVVSHSPSRKIRGALHEETIYGYVGEDENGKSVQVVHRIPIDSIKPGQIDSIRDPFVREQVRERMQAHGNDAKKAFGDPEQPLLHHDGKTPIRSVRILQNKHPLALREIGENVKGKPEKVVLYGSNHHVEIFEEEATGNRIGRFVTMFEAANRVRRNGQPLINKEYKSGWIYIMSLGINDMVLVSSGDQEILCRVLLTSGANNIIDFQLHTASNPSDRSTVIRKTPNSLRCRKVSVDPLGKLSPAHD